MSMFSCVRIDCVDQVSGAPMVSAVKAWPPNRAKSARMAGRVACTSDMAALLESDVALKVDNTQAASGVTVRCASPRTDRDVNASAFGT